MSSLKAKNSGEKTTLGHPIWNVTLDGEFIGTVYKAAFGFTVIEGRCNCGKMKFEFVVGDQTK
jgi:hypothetical protein